MHCHLAIVFLLRYVYTCVLIIVSLVYKSWEIRYLETPNSIILMTTDSSKNQHHSLHH